MPVELRKRKEAPPAPVRTAKKKAPPKATKSQGEESIVQKAQGLVEGTVEKVKKAVTGSNGAASSAGGVPKAGDTVDLTTFGGEIETHDGTKTTLGKLLEESGSGGIFFTYPKANTPGCTTQACLFRDSYTNLTATGFSVFGLSNDSPKSNTTFKTKQNLPYTLLCDPAQTLISAMGFKKAPKGTTRAVFIIDKSGKVLASEVGGPAATFEVAKKLVQGHETAGSSAADAKTQEDKEAANTAAEVADTAAKVDSNKI